MERRPAGVVVDPPTELPDPQPTGAAERRLVALSPALDTRPAVEVVDRFFRAVVEERPEDLQELLDPSARMWAGRHRRQVSLLTAWAERLSRLDYASLAGTVIYRPRDLEVYRGIEAQELAKTRALPMVPRASEVLVRIRMSPVAAGGNRLFGDEVVFLLRKGETGYKIVQMREDFRLP